MHFEPMYKYDNLTHLFKPKIKMYFILFNRNQPKPKYELSAVCYNHNK